MNLENQIRDIVLEAVNSLYGQTVNSSIIQVQLTRKDQTGDFTVVVFPLLKISGKKPEDTGNDLGNYIMNKLPIIESFETVKGFLNLTLSDNYWLSRLKEINTTDDYGFSKVDENSPIMMIEYSSPNTNKPLHLGHIRNNLLGFSLSRIAAVTGNKVVKTNIVNDRGIHICKSMLAWQKWGNGETPQSTGKKGDHLVGDYYVKFDKEYKSELAALESKGISRDDAEKQSLLMSEAREMLLKWEAGDKTVVELWETMNSWVYAGFEQTYKAMGVDFDKIYYESQTYIDGKEKVNEIGRASYRERV